MFFLLRMGFWFSLVLLALPLDAGMSAGQPSVGPLQALAAAREAVGDIAGLCERKPEVCATGVSAAQIVAARAKEGGRIAFDLIEAGGDATRDADALTGTAPTRP